MTIEAAAQQHICSNNKDNSNNYLGAAGDCSERLEGQAGRVSGSSPCGSKPAASEGSKSPGF